MFVVKFKDVHNEVYDTIVTFSVFVGEEIVLCGNEGVYTITKDKITWWGKARKEAKEITGFEIIQDSNNNHSCEKVIQEEIVKLGGCQHRYYSINTESIYSSGKCVAMIVTSKCSKCGHEIEETTKF